MNKYESNESEDGQISEIEDSHDEGDTADSLDIKPPQAINRNENSRYSNKDKKTSKEKKHSRADRRHRERERGGNSGAGAEREQRDDHRRRHRAERDNRYHGFSGSGGGRIQQATGKTDRDIARYEQQQQQQQQEQQQQQQVRNDPREREHYRNEQKDRNKVRTERDNDRDRERRSKDSPKKSDSVDRVLQDLRCRLLSKRSKFESDKRHDDRLPQGIDYEKRRIEKEITRYEYESRREKEGGNVDRRNPYYHRENRDYRERKQMVEVIDSPENYGETQQILHKASHKEIRHSRMGLEDKEQVARRAKLIEAAREMARRKELAREELEARRELRREREEIKTSSESPELPKKRKISPDEEEEMKKLNMMDTENIDETVVMVSDNSEDDTESEYGSSSHTEEDEEEEHDDERDDESKDEVSDGEIPGSPLSIGELTKSDMRRASRSGSRSLSGSRSRSHSKSKSRSPTPRSGGSMSRSRSRSKSKTSDTEEGKELAMQQQQQQQQELQQQQEQQQEEENAKKIEEKPEVKDELPPYFPAIQGCRSVEEFQCLNRIEEGTYGVVYRAKDKRTDEIVALKRLKMEKEKEGFPITSLREINTLLKGQHPNIVTVREIVVGSNMDKIFIVMDYVEHDLKSLMETMKYKKQVFLPGEVKCLTQQLLRAVAHLHDNWILHRDLKTSNLLLSHKGILKVGDFGLAREYGSPLKAYTSVVVTLWYRAPELLLCCKEYSIPIDMWSVGCIFAEFLAMNALFPGKSEVDQLNRIFKDLGTPNERIWIGYNELPAVQKMTFTEYPVSNLRKKFSHFTSEIGLSLLQGLLTYDPKQRLTAEQALRSSYFKELPLPIDPAMFPTWPAKSEIGLFKALSTNIKPSGGDEFKKLADHENREEQRWGASMMESRQMAMGPGFSLKF